MEHPRDLLGAADDAASSQRKLLKRVDCARCDDHQGRVGACRKSTHLLDAIFPKRLEGQIGNARLMLLEEVLMGAVSERDVPKADGYRHLASDSQFAGMLRDAIKCTAGIKSGTRGTKDSSRRS